MRGRLAITLCAAILAACAPSARTGSAVDVGSRVRLESLVEDLAQSSEDVCLRVESLTASDSPRSQAAVVWIGFHVPSDFRPSILHVWTSNTDSGEEVFDGGGIRLGS